MNMSRDLTTEDLAVLSLFGDITKVTPIDYVDKDIVITFLVDKRDLGRAIGKKAVNLKKLKKKFNKIVVIIPKYNDPEHFTRNFFKNIRIIDTEVREAMGEKTLFLSIDERDRGIAIGKEGSRIKTFKEFLKRLFNMSLNMKAKRILDM